MTIIIYTSIQIQSSSSNITVRQTLSLQPVRGSITLEYTARGGLDFGPGSHVLPSGPMVLIMSFTHLLVFATGCRLVVGCRRFVVPCLLGFIDSDRYGVLVDTRTRTAGSSSISKAVQKLPGS